MSLKPDSKIPNRISRIVKMGNFGKIDLNSYSCEKRDPSWEDNLNIFHQTNSKEYRKKMKVRKEVHEYPNNPLEEALMDKLAKDKVVDRI